MPLKWHAFDLVLLGGINSFLLILISLIFLFSKFFKSVVTYKDKEFIQ